MTVRLDVTIILIVTSNLVRRNQPVNSQLINHFCASGHCLVKVLANKSLMFSEILIGQLFYAMT